MIKKSSCRIIRVISDESRIFLFYKINLKEEIILHLSRLNYDFKTKIDELVERI